MTARALSEEARARLAEAGRRGGLARKRARDAVSPDPPAPADPESELALARREVRELRDRSAELRSRIQAAEDAIRAAKRQGRDVAAHRTEIEGCRHALNDLQKPAVLASARLRSLLDRERERRERLNREEQATPSNPRRREIVERRG